MNISLTTQLLSCLMLYASCAQAIMVKFGTKGGPIEPPTPEPLPAPQPYRVPAPVWEPRSDDVPDPNAQWRPQQMFFPQQRYTQVVFNSKPSPPVQTSAQRFVNAYVPNQSNNARATADNVNPSQFLGTQNLPGIGLRYFVPAYINAPQARKEEKRQEDSKHNDIETNSISDSHRDSEADVLWKYEKDSAKRFSRHTLEASRPIYQWPVYVQPRY